MTKNACAIFCWVEMDVNKQSTKTKKMLVQQIAKTRIKYKHQRIICNVYPEHAQKTNQPKVIYHGFKTHQILVSGHKWSPFRRIKSMNKEH